MQACAVLAKQLVALRKQKNRSYATGSRISAVGNQQKVNEVYLWKKKKKLNFLSHCIYHESQIEVPEQTIYGLQSDQGLHYLLNHWILQNVWMESKGTDDTLHMRRMIWICMFFACSKAHFYLMQPIYTLLLQWYDLMLCMILSGYFLRSKDHVKELKKFKKRERERERERLSCAATIILSHQNWSIYLFEHVINSWS